MWKVGKEAVVRKSRFVGRAIYARTLDEARQLLRGLKNDEVLRRATHNISATRIQVGETSVLEEANDNGEPPAASRILQIMRNENLSNAVVVVSRWYGGQKLGSERFKVIDGAAKSAIAELMAMPTDGKKATER